MEGNIIKKFYELQQMCTFLSGRLARSVYSLKLPVMLHVELGRMLWSYLDARWDQEPHRRQEAGEQGRWVGPILLSETDLCSFSWQAAHVATIGSWSWWQHGQRWAPFASVPATEGQAYWEAVWWTQWVRQTCCINSVFAAVARNKP